MLDKIKSHLIEIFACMFLILFIFWSVGYWANALLNTKFDLASCWGGVAALGGSGTQGHWQQLNTFMIQNIIQRRKNHYENSNKRRALPRTR